MSVGNRLLEVFRGTGRAGSFSHQALDGWDDILVRVPAVFDPDLDPGKVNAAVRVLVPSGDFKNPLSGFDMRVRVNNNSIIIIIYIIVSVRLLLYLMSVCCTVCCFIVFDFCCIVCCVFGLIFCVITDSYYRCSVVLFETNSVVPFQVI